MNSHFAVSSATPYQKIKILYRENYIQLLRISSNLIILLKRAPLLTIKYRCPEFEKKFAMKIAHLRSLNIVQLYLPPMKACYNAR